MLIINKKRREPVEPQLATMIDVFSILIIFLIAGAVADSNLTTIPIDLSLGLSKSKESINSAPQVTYQKKTITIDFIKESILIDEISNKNSSKFIAIKNKIEKYRIKKDEKDNNVKLSSLASFNLVADKNTDYIEIYSIINFMKQFGFENAILMANPKK